MDFLLTILIIFGIIVLITLIILIVRLNFTISKIDYLLDDFSKKMSSVNHAFAVVDKITDSVSLVNDRLVEAAISLIANIISKKKSKEKNEEEEEEF